VSPWLEGREAFNLKIIFDLRQVQYITQYEGDSKTCIGLVGGQQLHLSEPSYDKLMAALQALSAPVS
jgi:hypothetical protein